MRSEPLTFSTRARSRLVAPGFEASASSTRALSRTGALPRVPFFGGLLRGFGCFPPGCFFLGRFLFRFGFGLCLWLGGRLCSLRRFLLFLCAALGDAVRDQRGCLFERDGLGIAAARNRRVCRTIGHIGTIAAF